MAIKGYALRVGVEPPTPWDINAIYRARRDFKSMDVFIAKIEELRKYLREQLLWI